MRKRLLILAPSSGMGTNLYRATAPFSELRRKYDLDVFVHTGQSFRWDEAAYFDMAFFLWPNTDEVIATMGQLKFMGIPIWSDFDDDPTNLPEDNPAHKDYAEGTQVRKCIDFAIAESDIVTVSTHRLSYTFGAKNKNVQVIPNAYWDTMWRFTDFPRKKAILWRGALGHNNDMESVFPEIIELQTKYPDWPWVFVGEPNKELIELMDPKMVVTIPYQHPNAYIRTLIDLACPIQVVPLLNSEFNKNKSNCSWLEACCSGTAVIAPEYLQEFDKPGITRYQDNNDFRDKVELLINDQDLCRELVKKSRWEIKKNYLLSDVNKARAKILGLV